MRANEKKVRGKTEKDTHHYLNCFGTAGRVEQFEGMGFQMGPHFFCATKVGKATTIVDLSCLFLNMLAVGPGALKHAII